MASAPTPPVTCKVKGCERPRAYDRRCNEHGMKQAMRIRNRAGGHR